MMLTVHHITHITSPSSSLQWVLAFNPAAGSDAYETPGGVPISVSQRKQRERERETAEAKAKAKAKAAAEAAKKKQEADSVALSTAAVDAAPSNDDAAAGTGETETTATSEKNDATTSLSLSSSSPSPHKASVLPIGTAGAGLADPDNLDVNAMRGVDILNVILGAHTHPLAKKVFRDLSKPVGALAPRRLAQILERYECFKDNGVGGMPPFHYGSHYSNAAIVIFYLMRLEPFASMHIELQSGKFDFPDRYVDSPVIVTILKHRLLDYRLSHRCE
jgi:hypothetical protein